MRVARVVACRRRVEVVPTSSIHVEPTLRAGDMDDGPVQRGDLFVSRVHMQTKEEGRGEEGESEDK